MSQEELDKPNKKQGSQMEASTVGESDAATRERRQQRLAMRRAGAVDLDFQPAKLGSSPLACDSDVVALIRLKPGTTTASYASEAEFLGKACETIQVPARIYRSDQHVLEVVVPEAYAQELAVVRAQRRQWESKTEQASQALVWLANHPLGSRALPEDLCLIIDALPRSTLIDRVILSGEPNPYDVLYKRKYGDDFVSAADTGKNRTMIFYQRNFDGYLAKEVFHE